MKFRKTGFYFLTRRTFQFHLKDHTLNFVSLNKQSSKKLHKTNHKKNPILSPAFYLRFATGTKKGMKIDWICCFAGLHCNSFGVPMDGREDESLLYIYWWSYSLEKRRTVAALLALINWKEKGRSIGSADKTNKWSNSIVPANLREFRVCFPRNFSIISGYSLDFRLLSTLFFLQSFFFTE